MVRALQRPRASDHAAGRGRAARELADGIGANPGDRLGPLRVLRYGIIETEQVAAERLEADAIACDELRIVARFGEKRVHHRQHQRGVGIGADRHPLCAEKVGRIGPERGDGNELDAGLFRASQPRLHGVRAGAAGGDLAVLGGEPAEGKDQPRVLDDRGPVGDLAYHRLEGADHPRQDVLRRAEAVIGDLVDAAAAEEQKPPQQAAGMMDAACRRPAIGAAENRGMTECFAHARKLGGDGGEGFLPGYLAETVGAGALLSLAPAFADGGPRDA